MRHKQPWKVQFSRKHSQFCCNAATPRVVENNEIITLLLLLLLFYYHYYAEYLQL